MHKNLGAHFFDKGRRTLVYHGWVDRDRLEVAALFGTSIGVEKLDQLLGLHHNEVSGRLHGLALG